MKIPNLVNFENWSSISAWSCRLSLAPSLPIKASASPSPTYLVCYFKQHNPLPPLRSPRSLLSPFSSLLPPPLSSQSRSLPLPPLLSPLFSSRKPPPPETDYLFFSSFFHISIIGFVFIWIYLILIPPPLPLPDILLPLTLSSALKLQNIINSVLKLYYTNLVKKHPENS